MSRTYYEGQDFSTTEKNSTPVGTGKYKIVQNRKKAIEHALRYARKNDIVVIAGKGHETYQEIKGEKQHFDDREVAAAVLKRLPETKVDTYKYFKEIYKDEK